MKGRHELDRWHSRAVERLRDVSEARRLGEIAGPMLDRLHAQRERLSWVVESSEAWVLLTPVVRFQWQRVVFLLALGPWRVGVSWRRV